MVEIEKTEDENYARPKVTENQTNHVVVTLSQQGSTVLSRSRNIIYYVIAVVKNDEDMMKIMVHGKLNIYFSFHRK